MSIAPQFADVKNGYATLFNEAEILPQHAEIVDQTARKCLSIMNDPRIAEVSQRTGVPKIFIVLCMHEESGLNWGCHLHNGDPLTARTVQVPAGRPVTGEPPFDWVFSAIDAMQYENLQNVTDWGIARCLYLWESFNGWGYYAYHHINSPYLWSFSNLYTKGKYGSDSNYDPNLVSEQIGVAVLMKRMIEIDPSCSPEPERPSIVGTIASDSHLRQHLYGAVAIVVGGVMNGLQWAADRVSDVMNAIPGVSSDYDQFMPTAQKVATHVGMPWQNIAFITGATIIGLSLISRLAKR